ncbi:hypothetical protein BDN71DRAFT_1434154 [Pleurotus eryngii]|uniref:Uncharacterized protein n=1 Tax=Pleurotus eryngii TaxID=5323 RepID=A0A9P5ZPE3_PLEER|nr:hypothetical protein BDN71DRAFT_1434154 [Pleurotus eryngii]
MSASRGKYVPRVAFEKAKWCSNIPGVKRDRWGGNEEAMDVRDKQAVPLLAAVFVLGVEDREECKDDLVFVVIDLAVSLSLAVVSADDAMCCVIHVNLHVSDLLSTLMLIAVHACAWHNPAALTWISVPGLGILAFFNQVRRLHLRKSCAPIGAGKTIPVSTGIGSLLPSKDPTVEGRGATCLVQAQALKLMHQTPPQKLLLEPVTSDLELECLTACQPVTTHEACITHLPFWIIRLSMRPAVMDYAEAGVSQIIRFSTDNLYFNQVPLWSIFINYPTIGLDIFGSVKGMYTQLDYCLIVAGCDHSHTHCHGKWDVE